MSNQCAIANAVPMMCSTVLTSAISPLTRPTMRISKPMLLRVPESLASDVVCPKCDATNATDLQHYIWRVADERGLHWECDACGHHWGHKQKFCPRCSNTLRDGRCLNLKCQR